MKNIIYYRYTEAGIALPGWRQKVCLAKCFETTHGNHLFNNRESISPPGALHRSSPSPPLSTNQSQGVEHTGLVSIKKPQNVSG